MGIQKQLRTGTKVDPRIILPEIPTLVGKKELDQPALNQFWKETQEALNRYAQSVSGALPASTTTQTTTTTSTPTTVQEVAPAKAKVVESAPVVTVTEAIQDPTVLDRILTDGENVLIGANGDVLWA